MKILVVEDDRKVAGFIELGLKEEGYVVDVAPDGDEATMLAHVYDYDVILLDVVLPKKNGFQIAAELRRELATADRAVDRESVVAAEHRHGAESVAPHTRPGRESS